MVPAKSGLTRPGPDDSYFLPQTRPDAVSVDHEGLDAVGCDKLEAVLQNSNRNMRTRRTALMVAANCALLLAGCGGRAYLYDPVDTDGLRQRAETQADGPIVVSAAVPGREETRAIFGIDLYDQGIQPVWLQIENTGSPLARYAPVSTDHFYFSPLEVAYKNRRGYSDAARDRMNERFSELSMPRYVYPGQSRQGFVFTHADPGAKGFNVDVFSFGASRHFTFLLRVPGFVPDYARLDINEIYAAGDIAKHSLDDLPAALRDLPCCSTDARGQESGEPINIVLVGKGEELLRGLLRSGWRETSVKEAAGLPQEYLYGRPQDAIFRHLTVDGSSFYELRFWLAPIESDGERIWVGQAKHYYRWLGITLLDADVDNARNFAIQKVLYGQALKATAWLAGQEVVTAGTFWNSLIASSYFTDGYRAVLWLSGAPHSALDVDVLNWDLPPRWTE